ncbi:hypothetical protein AAEP93_010503 [Penicillium crustosum]
MYRKSALALVLLPQLISTCSIGHDFSRRRVDCTFTVAASSGDTCETFADSWGITTKELRSAVTTSSSTETTKTLTTTSSATDHEPTQPGLAENSGITHSQFLKWNPYINEKRTNIWPDYFFHKVGSGDQCHSIQTEYKITLKQFIDWNPAINSDCTNLQLDYNVCDHIPGATNTHNPTPQMPNLPSYCKT